MSTYPTQPPPPEGGPQDAPVPSRGATASPEYAEPGAGLPHSAPSPTPPARREVVHVPPPTGPNWGLVVWGLLALLVAAGVVAHQVAGFTVDQLREVGPGVLVVGGLACAVIGVIGMVARRTR